MCCNVRNGNSGRVIANRKVEYSQLSKIAEEARRRTCIDIVFRCSAVGEGGGEEIQLFIHNSRSIKIQCYWTM